MLSSFFGGLALLLSALGLYGMTAHAAARRRSEIGIRLALGATPMRVLRMVLLRTLTVTGAGMLVGMAASVWASRFIASLLFRCAAWQSGHHRRGGIDSAGGCRRGQRDSGCSGVPNGSRQRLEGSVAAGNR